jgi:hypothetical protein
MRKQSSQEPDAALSTVYVERLLSSNAATQQQKNKLFLLSRKIKKQHELSIKRPNAKN